MAALPLIIPCESFMFYWILTAYFFYPRLATEQMIDVKKETVYLLERLLFMMVLKELGIQYTLENMNHHACQVQKCTCPRVIQILNK